MAIELKQTVKLSQQLLITPQLQQAIKILQLTRAELVETVQNELLENPVLEEQDEGHNTEPVENFTDNEKIAQETTQNDPNGESTTSVESASEQQDFNWGNFIESTRYNPRETNFSQAENDESPAYENMLSQATTLHDYLEWQIKMGSLLPEEEDACHEVIGNLDDNGYLQTSLEEMAQNSGLEFNSLEDALCIIQDLDPAGVGARDLRECLMLQVREMGEDRPLLEEIILHHLSLLERRDFVVLGRKISVSPKRARELGLAVIALEPKPGRIFGKGEVPYIIPDIYVKKVGADFIVVLNEDGLPKLQISQLYRSVLMREGLAVQPKDIKPAEKSGTSSDTKNYIQDKLRSALWLIKSIHQRQKTLYKVTKSIVQFQHDFFERGVSFLKPLVLRTIAEEIGVHESTVSRATNGKYVHTPQGIFELKYFFNTGISHNAGGEDFANEVVKQMIRKFVGMEDAKKPLSDQSLAVMLKNQNMNIARRTVAKYREVMGILPSSRRRRLD